MDIDPNIGRGIAVGGVMILTGAMATLRKVCGPAAEQLGQAMGDKVAAWRARNFIDSMRKTEEMLTKNQIPEDCQAHPRVTHAIVEQMSWIEDPLVQDMWAGLLASSCTPEGDDDSNLPFTNLLSSMTKLQARILKYSCEQATPMYSRSGLVTAVPQSVRTEQLLDAVGPCDIQRLDRELDSLRHMGLLEVRGGFGPHEAHADLTPSTLALHMYIRANGSREEPAAFFVRTGKTPVPAKPDQLPATQN